MTNTDLNIISLNNKKNISENAALVKYSDLFSFFYFPSKSYVFQYTKFNFNQ